MIDEQIVPNFWLSEFLDSDIAARFGIDNTPPQEVRVNVRVALASGMQAVRDLLGYPVFITSGYRCPELNAKVKGSPTSAHMQGLAADFKCPNFGTPLAVARFLSVRQPNLRFDQLIQEGTWVHIAFPAGSAIPRGEVLTAHFGGPTTYTKGLA